ncbi:MAG: Uma2 family endonuclease [Oscillospiraceae bacterium]|jgi:Uma2 family endonuclease|nr:Uma2 family endonuclease [Oscillospiraceae bacterium]
MYAIDKGKRYTYDEYLSWDTPDRYELLEGVPRLLSKGERLNGKLPGDDTPEMMMAPAPGERHQSAGGEIYRQLSNYLRKRPCKVYAAPFDVKLRSDEKAIVVEPDIVVVCDRSKITERGCDGAPDLCVEVLSPSTWNYDMGVKYQLYLNAGVREYWIVDPESKKVYVHVLQAEEKYLGSVYEPPARVPVSVLEGCEIDLGEVFAE